MRSAASTPRRPDRRGEEGVGDDEPHPGARRGGIVLDDDLHAEPHVDGEAGERQHDTERDQRWPQRGDDFARGCRRRAPRRAR